MKKIELLAELAKAKRIMDTTEYYTLDHSNAFREVKHAKVLFFRLKEHPICRLFSTKRNPV